MSVSKIKIEKTGKNSANRPGFAVLENLVKRQPGKSRSGRYLAWRISAGYYIKHFGLKYREADRISSFIYRVNGEEDRTFLWAMETWVREVALLKGGIGEILDAISILSVCRIDPGNIRTCLRVRREVIRYVRSRYVQQGTVISSGSRC